MMPPTLNPVDLVMASAGTGKTYRLTQTLCQWVTDSAAPIEPEAILATTFTVKAAGELVQRTRGRLLEHDDSALAERMLGGRIGTVNAMAGRLIAEFALDAGLSPVTDVLDGDRQRMFFRMATADAIDRRLGSLADVSARLGLDLVESIGCIVDAARHNGITGEGLADCAQRSWQGVRALLPEPIETAGVLDRALQQAVDAALTALASSADPTQATKNVARGLSAIKPGLDAPETLSWEDWARLTKLKPGAASRSIVTPVREAAAVHPRHPRLHADLERLIRGVFDAAAEVSQLYDRTKRELGLIDFIDQERIALDLLDCPQAASRLRERVRLVLVDEFQDTSPLQLALFLRLARIVGRSLWVGDPKQAIYGFRGTDPELIQGVSGHIVQATNGSICYLDTSYRARPGLVAFINDLFVPAFAGIGVQERETRIAQADRQDAQGQPGPLELWWLGGSNWEQALSAVTEGVRTILAAPECWPLPDRGDRRPIHGGDIAILCRSNDRCVTVATALAAAGFKVGVARDDLMDQPEVVHAFAALRYLVDPKDTLAVAEMLHLRTAAADGPVWLDRWLAGERDSLLRERPELAALDAARPNLAGATPAEALDLALAASDSVTFAKRLGDPRRRIPNLDALRGLALDYEDQCMARRGAATASGLVAFLRSEVVDGGPQPASPDRDAVQVLTYHKAKGLEWPVVILLDLHSGPRDRTFGLTVEPREDGLDVRRPLDGRWLRFWPWPYGHQQKEVHLDTMVVDAPESHCGQAREHAEMLRLLYVGMTRARDYLVLAARPGKSGTAWLDALKDGSGTRLLQLPVDDGSQQIVLAGSSHSVQVRSFEPQVAAAAARVREAVYAVEPIAYRPPRVPYRLRPSERAGSVSMDIAEEIVLGDRLPLIGATDMATVGEVLHRFLAADVTDRDRTWRIALAERLLAAWGMVNVISPECCVAAADRLGGFLSQRYHGAFWCPEWPVTGSVDGQRVRGQIDLLLEGSDRLAIVDHKSFPGRREDWSKRAIKAGAQIATYADLARASTGLPVDLWVHLPIVGRMMRLAPLEAPQRRTEECGAASN